jgi:hypothetical protein
MWQSRMVPQLKSVERPERAKSQKTGRQRKRSVSQKRKEKKSSRTDFVTKVFINVEVCQGSPDEHGEEGVEGARRFVDIGEDLGSVASFGERSKGTRTRIHARKTDGQDGDTNGHVDQMVHAVDVGQIEGDNERRGSSARFTSKTGLGVGNHETDDGKGKNVDDGDTPEGSLNSGGHSFTRVGSFGSSKTNKLGSS